MFLLRLSGLFTFCFRNFKQRILNFLEVVVGGSDQFTSTLFMFKQVASVVFFSLVIGTVIGVPHVKDNLSKTTEFSSLNHTLGVDSVTHQNPDEKKCTIPRGSGRRDDCSTAAFTERISWEIRTDALAG